MIIDDDSAVDLESGGSSDFSIRLDTNGDDDKVRGQDAAILQHHALDRGVADKPRGLDIEEHLDALGLDSALQHGRRGPIELTLHQAIHQVNERHPRASLGETIRGFEPQKSAADDNDTAAVAAGTRDRGDVGEIAKREDAGEIGSRNRQAYRPRAGRDHELGEAERPAVGERHHSRRRINR